MAIEYVLDEIARALGRDPLDVRRVNFYGTGARDVTPYGMRVEDFVADRSVRRARAASSDYARPARGDRRVQRGEPGREARHRADAGEVRHLLHRHVLQPGERAGARLHRRQRAAQPRRHRDGAGTVHQGRPGGRATSSVSISTGCASSATDTEKMPNTSATAASSRQRPQRQGRAGGGRGPSRRAWSRSRRAHPGRPAGGRPASRRPRRGRRREAAHLRRGRRGSRTASACRSRRAGFYRTPKIHCDRETLRGRPFYYFAYGAAVSEVAIDTLTGEYAAPPGRHPARRRPHPQPGDRPRPGRGRLRPGHGLAHHRGAVVGRRRAAR